MCGISGSNNREQAFKLYQINLDRGYYSSGYYGVEALCSSRINFKYKVLGTFVVPIGDTDLTQYYLYHSRGPTVETTSFVPENNHPFEFEGWVVSHNGIISNFDSLCTEYFPEESFEGKTDSCIIPRLLYVKPSIKEALECLKGTFAVWIYHKSSHRLFIARSGSTLYGDCNTGDFSSTEFKGSISLKEGTLYEVENFSKLTEKSTFRFNSPYFVL